MLLVETKTSNYETVSMLLHELFPFLKIELISDVSHPQIDLPYSFTIDITVDELDEMMDILTQIEVDAFNTSNGEMPSIDDRAYQKYEKYGWLWDLFYRAEEYGDIQEISD